MEWTERRGLLGRHPALGFAYAVAAGLVIGSLTTLAVIGTLTRRPAKDLPIAGTMAPTTGRVVAAGKLDLPGARFEAETRRIDRISRLRLWGRSSAPADLTIEFEPEQLRLVSMAPADPGNLRIESSNGQVRVTSTGEVQLELSWIVASPAPSPISIRARVDEKEETMTLVIDPKQRDSPNSP